MTGKLWLFFFLLLVVKPVAGDGKRLKEGFSGITPSKNPEDGESLPKLFKLLRQLGIFPGDNKGLVTTTYTNTNTDLYTQTPGYRDNIPIPDSGYGKYSMKKTEIDLNVDKVTPGYKGGFASQDPGDGQNGMTNAVDSSSKNTAPGYEGNTLALDSGDRKSLVEINEINHKIKNFTSRHQRRRGRNYFFTGPCSATCGIGLKDIFRTRGCPDDKDKCHVGIQECRASPDCGWGGASYKSGKSVQMACIYKHYPERFSYEWRTITKTKELSVLQSGDGILEVSQDSEGIIYQCNTLEKNQIVATIKYKVISKVNYQTEKSEYNTPEFALLYVFMALPVLVIIVCLFCV